MDWLLKIVNRKRTSMLRVVLTDNLVRDGIVVGMLEKRFHKELLQESKLTLQSCIDICRASECTN